MSQVIFSIGMLKRLRDINKKFGDPIASEFLFGCYTKQDGIHHIMMRDGEKIVSYCPAGKEQEVKFNDEGIEIWGAKNRQTMRMGKMVRDLLPCLVSPANDYISDKQIEEFVNRMCTTVEDENCMAWKMELVNGRELGECYNLKAYIDESDCDGGSSLWGSCMRRFAPTSSTLWIYTQNPDKVQMLVMRRKSDNLVMGRALVWKLDDGRTFMDRIYVGRQAWEQCYKAYASQNGWIYKKQQASGSENFIMPDGTTAWQPKLCVTGLTLNSEDAYPYMDTLYYAVIPMLSEHYPSLTVNEGGVGNYAFSKFVNRQLNEQGTDGDQISVYTSIVTGNTFFASEAIRISAGLVRENVGAYAEHEHTVEVMVRREEHEVMAEKIYFTGATYRRFGYYHTALKSECQQHSYDGTWYFADNLVTDAAGNLCLEMELREAPDGKKYYNGHKIFTPKPSNPDPIEEGCPCPSCVEARAEIRRAQELERRDFDYDYVDMRRPF